MNDESPYDASVPRLRRLLKKDTDPGEYRWDDDPRTLELRAALRELVRQSEIQGLSFARDHGCSWCFPGGELTAGRYRCALHTARGLL